MLYLLRMSSTNSQADILMLRYLQTSDTLWVKINFITFQTHVRWTLAKIISIHLIQKGTALHFINLWWNAGFFQDVIFTHQERLPPKRLAFGNDPTALDCGTHPKAAGVICCLPTPPPLLLHFDHHVQRRRKRRCWDIKQEHKKWRLGHYHVKIWQQHLILIVNIPWWRLDR